VLQHQDNKKSCGLVNEEEPGAKHLLRIDLAAHGQSAIGAHRQRQKAEAAPTVLEEAKWEAATWVELACPFVFAAPAGD
jgi:hypothetical protein